MRVPPSAARWAEGFCAGAAAALLGLLSPSDPSFAGIGLMPQVVASTLAAALLGAGPGFLALAGAALAEALLPAAASAVGLGLAFPGPASLLAAARLPAAAALGCVLAAGGLRDAYGRSVRRVMSRLRGLSRRAVQLKKMNEALAGIVDELERRVSGQRDSISALYARIKKMDSADLDAVLKGLLEAVAAFSQASAAAVYEFEPESGLLRRRAFAGPEPAAELRPEDGIEGWVFRNDSPFSLRSVNDYLNFPRVERPGSILAYPLRSGDLLWGALNVSEMPFYRYNPVTENNLGIVVALASTYIKKAVDARDRALRGVRDEATGLPGAAELLLVLGEELERRSVRGLHVSVVMVELLGHGEMAASGSGLEALGLLKDLAAAAEGGRAIAFGSGRRGRLAFILPDAGRDVASLFCLDLSERAGEGRRLAGGGLLRADLAFGFSTYPGSAAAAAVPAASRPAALVAEAESVLGISRKAFEPIGGGRP